MSYCYHHPDKWASANIDLIEEKLEKESKAVVFVAGASSSGKSYCAKMLSSVLKQNGHNSFVLSLDNYNVGLSHLIPLKVAQNHYSHFEHLEEISSAIRPLLETIPFESKYDEDSLRKISPLISKYFDSEEELNKFLSLLNQEWNVLNFDEPIVYDMNLAANDVKALLSGDTIQKKLYSKIISERVKTDELISGKDYDVIIVEGIYALNDSLTNLFDRDEIITNFIDGNPKSLFLRRIIRDSKNDFTSASAAFTIKQYFRNIIPSYISTIIPSMENADVIYINDMTYLEKKTGELYMTKMDIHTNSRHAVEHILRNSQIRQVTYVKDTFFSTRGEATPFDNVLRLRAYSSDEGKSYVPSSLVHKGLPKVRKDDKVIRPIDVLIREGDFFKVWKDEMECLSDFASAGFLIGPIQHKIKWKLEYKGHRLTIRFVESQGYFIEFDDADESEVIEYVKSTIKSHKSGEK